MIVALSFEQKMVSVKEQEKINLLCLYAYVDCITEWKRFLLENQGKETWMHSLMTQPFDKKAFTFFVMDMIESGKQEIEFLFEADNHKVKMKWEYLDEMMDKEYIRMISFYTEKEGSWALVLAEEKALIDPVSESQVDPEEFGERVMLIS